MDGSELLLHDWNIVKISNIDFIIDCTWGRNDIEFNFLASPDYFIYTHFPLNKSFQLLKNPININYFTSLPYYYSDHFKFENHLNKFLVPEYSYTDIDKNHFYKINSGFNRKYYSDYKNDAYKPSKNIPLKEIYENKEL